MFRAQYPFVGMVIAVAAIGCGSPVKEEQIQVKSVSDPLARAASMLKRYADGEPLGSEATSFPDMVAAVCQVDATKAAILEAGLAEIQKASGASRPAKAKELLARLQPSAP